MTSFISPPRRCFTRCSPRTQAMASATLLLPQPFGPTIEVIPSPVKMRSVWSAKDLKPVISRRRSLNILDRHFDAGGDGHQGDFRVGNIKGHRLQVNENFRLAPVSKEISDLSCRGARKRPY